MRRIQKRPVRGISFKLQEEERERRDNYVPEVSALCLDKVEVDVETKNLLKALNFADLTGIVAPVESEQPEKFVRRYAAPAGASRRS